MFKSATTRKKMKLNTNSYTRLAVSEALIITLITLLCLPSAVSATLRGNVSPRRVGGSAVVAAHAPLVGLIEVNTTSDADNLDPNAGCDTDAATHSQATMSSLSTFQQLNRTGVPTVCIARSP